jgi:diguanylate cyclase (GGDEF)-like protein/PAS domain S-box-containing protein
MRRIFAWSVRLKPATVGFLVGLSVAITVVVVALTLYKVSVDAIHDDIRADLTRIAEVAASNIDGDLHRTFTSRDQEKTAAYQTAIAPLRKLEKSSDQISYIYTVVEANGGYRFVLDPTPQGDKDGDKIDDKSHIMQLWAQITDTAIDALHQHKAMAEEEPTTEQWGTFISGFAPFFDSKGKFVGIVGVDLDAKNFAARLAGVRRALAISLALGMMLSLAIGLLGGFAQRSALQSRREILERQREIAHAKNLLEEQHHQLQGAMASEQAAREQQRVASQRFQLLFNEMPVACFTFDGNGTIREWNDRFEALFGIEVENLFLQEVYKLFPDLGLPIMGVIGGEPIHDLEWKFQRKDGTELTLLTDAFSFEIGEEQVGGIGSILNITYRKMLELKVAEQLALMQELSVTDALTGVRNRRALEAEAERFFKLAQRNGEPLSLLMMDVDKFKSYNDTFGHQAGDEVLKTVAKLLTKAARECDLVARYGGEEFCVILPSTDAHGAVLAAERFRAAIEAFAWSQRPVTASFGASTVHEHLNPEELLKDADLALYAAKEAGRNRTMHRDNLGEIPKAA